MLHQKNLYYTNLLGQIKSHNYNLSSDCEGTLLFFPSSLNHCVHPYFNCDEERISVSGNISINTAKSF